MDLNLAIAVVIGPASSSEVWDISWLCCDSVRSILIWVPSCDLRRLVLVDPIHPDSLRLSPGFAFLFFPRGLELCKAGGVSTFFPPSRDVGSVVVSREA